MKKICSIDLIFTNMKLLSVDSYSQVRLSTKYIQCSNTVSLFLKLALAFKAWTQSEFWIQMRTCWIFYDYCCCQLLALRRALKVVFIMSGVSLGWVRLAYNRLDYLGKVSFGPILMTKAAVLTKAQSLNFF